MGEKSFFSILKKEDEIINQINSKKQDIFEFMKEYEKSDGKCSICKRMHDQVTGEVADLENELVSVRKEMQKYIKFIMEV